jgi:hypothetical protein
MYTTRNTGFAWALPRAASSETLFLSLLQDHPQEATSKYLKWRQNVITL